MISPQKIKYNNEEFNMYLSTTSVILDVSFESDNGEVSAFLNRSAVSTESHNGRYNNTYTYKYDELFSPRFTIVKSDFSDFSQQEIRKVLKYLTSTDKPALLEVYYEDNGSPDFCAVGGWTEIETYKLANNRVIGIVATFEATTPYALSALETNVFSSTEGYTNTITIDTDDNQPIYPRITIEQFGLIVDIGSDINYDTMTPNTIYKSANTYYWKSLDDKLEFKEGQSKPDYNWSVVQTEKALTSSDSLNSNTIYYSVATNKYYWMDPYTIHIGDSMPQLATTSVKITNTHNGINAIGQLPPLVVMNNIKDEKIIIDCENRVISSSRTSRIFGDDFNWNWLALYDEDNAITVEGNCKVTFEWRYVKKVGA